MRIILCMICCQILALMNFATAQAPGEDARRTTVDSRYAPFYHGVASGDPLPDRVILWTRLTYDTTATVAVDWTIATDTAMSQIVNAGTVTTDSSVDWTLKVDAAGLSPNTWYYYQFEFMGRKSIVGRTRTVPVSGVDSLRFAVLSCSHYETGYFNVYGRLTQRNDIDAILHLGDYIYEGGVSQFGSNLGREHEPVYEILSLDDYRIRHSQHKLDDDLRQAHQQYPWITVWDDHESANNSWRDGADNHDPQNEGPWSVRKASAIQAYFEWMPIRPDTAHPGRIYRKYQWGDLADLIMLDTRLEGRDEQVGNLDPQISDTSRTLLGADQRNWIYTQLDDSIAQWKVLGQQVMMAPLEAFGVPLNPDQWDGYTADRERVLNHIMNQNVENVVVLTGDIHTSWANDIPAPGQSYNPSTGAGSAAAEFVAPSVTTTNSVVTVPVSVLQLGNPHIKFLDLDKHGYIILDLNRSRAQSDWYFMNTVESPNLNDSWAAGWFVNAGERHIREANAAAPSPVVQVTPAPFNPPNLPISIGEPQAPVILSVSPNPFSDEAMVQYYHATAEDIEISVLDISGKEVLNQRWENAEPGLIHHRFNFRGAAPGIYILRLESGGRVATTRMYKAY